MTNDPTSKKTMLWHNAACEIIGALQGKQSADFETIHLIEEGGDNTNGTSKIYHHQPKGGTPSKYLITVFKL